MSSELVSRCLYFKLAVYHPPNPSPIPCACVSLLLHDANMRDWLYVPVCFWIWHAFIFFSAIFFPPIKCDFCIAAADYILLNSQKSWIIEMSIFFSLVFPRVSHYIAEGCVYLIFPMIIAPLDFASPLVCQFPPCAHLLQSPSPTHGLVRCVQHHAIVCHSHILINRMS